MVESLTQGDAASEVLVCESCGEPAAHVEWFGTERRSWCEGHTPWSGHHEFCGEACRGVQSDAFFAFLKRNSEEIAKWPKWKREAFTAGVVEACGVEDIGGDVRDRGGIKSLRERVRVLEERVAFAEQARDNAIAQRDEALARGKEKSRRAGEEIGRLKRVLETRQVPAALVKWVNTVVMRLSMARDYDVPFELRDTGLTLGVLREWLRGLGEESKDAETGKSEGGT